jgi:hypothetical protein
MSIGIVPGYTKEETEIGETAGKKKILGMGRGGILKKKNASGIDF